MQKISVQYLFITAEMAEQRIDNFLMNRLKGVPKTHIYRIQVQSLFRLNQGRHW
ncbi:MAG: hypothetical protein K0S63_1323 [Gammaproteobacteria bacterium]|nr:hypothetical protein [Gammaproteobacteria bacterium]